MRDTSNFRSSYTNQSRSPHNLHVSKSETNTASKYPLYGSPKPKPRHTNGYDSPQLLIGNRNFSNNESNGDEDTMDDASSNGDELEISDETPDGLDRLEVKRNYEMLVEEPKERRDISKSDIDLRKRDRLLQSLNDPAKKKMEKRASSLSRKDVEQSMSRMESEDLVADLRGLAPPRSANSPTPPASRPSASMTSVPPLWLDARPTSATFGGTDALSERSMASTSALYHVTTKHARDR